MVARGVSLVVWSAILGLAAALGLGVLRFVNSGQLQGMESVGTLALTLVYASPSLVALLSLRRGTDLLIAASLLGLAASVTAFSGVTLVLVVPSGAWVIAYLRSLRSGHRPRALPVLAGSLLVVAVVASFFALFLREDALCWRMDRRGAITHEPPVASQTLTIEAGEDTVAAGCTSDVITGGEALLSLGILGAGFLGGVSITSSPGGGTRGSTGVG